MTVSELYREVSQLGFETSLDDGVLRFYQALNRCLLQASRVKPVVKRVQIAHYRPKNLLNEAYLAKEYIHEAENVAFEATGALSYYFEASGGQGQYTLQKLDANGEWSTIGNAHYTDESGTFKSYSGTLQGVTSADTVRIVFSGDYFFVIRNMAFFAQKISATEIAGNAAYTEYDLPALFSDFNGLAAEPTAGDSGIALRGYSIIRQSVLCVPNDFSGAVTVEYEHLPTAAVYHDDPETDTAEVDADTEICAILPYLIASYVWIDDEPAKAQYYKVMYEERAQEIRNRLSVQTPIKINNNGW